MQDTENAFKTKSPETLNNLVYIYTHTHTHTHTGFLGGLVVMNLPAKAGDAGYVGSIPRSGRPPGGGNDNPFQYSCLGNPMDRGA